MSDELEDLTAAEILEGVDDTPLTPGEFDNMGGYKPLNTGLERLKFSKMVQTAKKAGRGYTKLNLRLEFEVPENGISNSPGRKCSIFFDFPSAAAQANDSGLKQNYDINLADFKKIVAAFLGCVSAEEPGDYPVVDDGAGGDALISPIFFITKPEYRQLLDGRTLLADLGMQSETWTDKDKVVHQRKSPSNTVNKPRIDSGE